MQIAKEAVQILYDDNNTRQFLMVGNGELKFFRIIPATAEDFEETVNAKEVNHD